MSSHRNVGECYISLMKGDSSMNKYDWLKKARIMCVESYFSPLYPKIEFDAEKMVKVMKDANANTLRFGTMGFYALYQSSFLPKHPDLGERDLLAKIIRRCHGEGMRVFTYVPVGHPLSTETYERYPHWARRTIENKPCFRTGWAKGLPDWYHICLNSPYYQVIHNVVKEICEGYDIDGMYFDGPYFSNFGEEFFSICYCPGCKTKFQNRYGIDLPQVKNITDINWNDKTLRLYLEWCTNIEAETLASLSKEVKTLKDIPLICNRDCYDYYPMKSRVSAQAKYVDGLLFEGRRNFQEKLEDVQSWGSAGKIIWNYTGLWDLWPRTSFGRLTLKLEGLITLAAGGTLLIGANRFFYDQSELKVVRELFSFMDDNSEILSDLQMSKFIALPYSEGTAERYGRGDPEKRYNSFFRSFFTVLRDMHYPFNMIPEEVLFSEGYLEKYKVICLSNLACMSDEQADMIRKFVRKGGGLVATYETSLYNEKGDKRDNFALSDLFNAKYVGESDVMFDTYLKIRTSHPSVRSSSPDKLIPQTEYLIIKAIKEKGVVADIISGEKVVSPGIITNTFGSGRVVYIPSSLERLYSSEVFRQFYKRIPQFRQVLEDALCWVLKDKVLCSINAPNGVSTVLAEKKGIYVLHLINYTGDKYEEPFCYIESITPVRNIKVRIKLPQDSSVKTLRLIMGKEQISYTQNNNLLEFTIPEIQEYEAVVIEHNKKQR